MNKKNKYMMIGVITISIFVLGFFALAQIDNVMALGIFMAAVTEEQSKEIALDYLDLDDAVVVGIYITTENRTDLYVVEIMDAGVLYKIYVNSRNGNVIGMIREEPGFQGIMTLPGLLTPEDLENFATD